MVRLLSDRPAGDARTGVSRRIGLHVISLLMNDQRRPAVREERVWTIAHVHSHVGHRGVGGSVLLYHEVVHVAGVWPLWVLQAMLLVLGIKVIAGRLESRPFTFRHLMKVNPVLTCRQVLQIQL